MADGTTLFIFPGQGSQYSGIGSDLFDKFPAAKSIYERANKTLGYDVAAMSFGEDESIHLTRHTQPVLLTHSIACLEALREIAPDAGAPAFAGGHSLGEYSALVAAGALTFEQGLGLVAKRGELMGEFGEGEMTALPLELEVAKKFADAHHCGIAGCNLADQTVVGGRPEDLEALEAAVLEEFPRKRPVRLKTEGAFHTFYMVAAAREFRKVLNDTEFATPNMQVLSNYTGGFHDENTDAIKSRLFWQLFHPVMWHANLMSAADAGVTRMVEFGGGIGKGETPGEKRANLEGIVKKAFRRADNAPEHLSVINAESVEATAAALS